MHAVQEGIQQRSWIPKLDCFFLSQINGQTEESWKLYGIV